MRGVQSLIEHQTVLRTPQALKKYSFKSGKEQKRVFSLDGSGLVLEWVGNGAFARKGTTQIADISEIREGNEAFECSKRRINLRLDPAELCFSLVTAQGPLFLVADSKETRDRWITALRAAKQDQAAGPLLNQAADGFVGELSALVEERQRLEIKLKSVTSQLDSMRDENEQLKSSLAASEEKSKGKEAEDVRHELEDYYNSLLVQRDQDISKQEKTVRSLVGQLKDQDAKSTASILRLEERLSESESKIRQSEADLSEYKETTKSRLSEAVDSKAGQYRHANKMLTAYVAHLKRTAEDLDREATLWRAAVHHFALVQYLEEHPGETPPTREVLRFALDHVERHYSSVSTQRELVDLLSQTRSIRSPQSLSWDFRA